MRVLGLPMSKKIADFSQECRQVPAMESSAEEHKKKLEQLPFVRAHRHGRFLF